VEIGGPASNSFRSKSTWEAKTEEMRGNEREKKEIADTSSQIDLVIG